MRRMLQKPPPLLTTMQHDEPQAGSAAHCLPQPHPTPRWQPAPPPPSPPLLRPPAPSCRPSSTPDTVSASPSQLSLAGGALSPLSGETSLEFGSGAGSGPGSDLAGYELANHATLRVAESAAGGPDNGEGSVSGSGGGQWEREGAGYARADTRGTSLATT